MKIYCGDYMNYQPPKTLRWGLLGLVASCVLFMSAATPAMINYYWNGQNSTDTLGLEEAISIAHDARASVNERKSAQSIAFIAAKRSIDAIKAAGQTEEIKKDAGILLRKLARQIGELK